jgi:hypothetical protein
MYTAIQALKSRISSRCRLIAIRHQQHVLPEFKIRTAAGLLDVHLLLVPVLMLLYDASSWDGLVGVLVAAHTLTFQHHYMQVAHVCWIKHGGFIHSALPPMVCCSWLPPVPV